MANVPDNDLYREWLDRWAELFVRSFERGFVEHLDPETYRAQTVLDPYRACTCGVRAHDPTAADPERHSPDCQYRNPTS